MKNTFYHKNILKLRLGSIARIYFACFPFIIKSRIISNKIFILVSWLVYNLVVLLLHLPKIIIPLVLLHFLISKALIWKWKVMARQWESTIYHQYCPLLHSRARDSALQGYYLLLHLLPAWPLWRHRVPIKVFFWEQLIGYKTNFFDPIFGALYRSHGQGRLRWRHIHGMTSGLINYKDRITRATEIQN